MNLMMLLQIQYLSTGKLMIDVILAEKAAA